MSINLTPHVATLLLILGVATALLIAQSEYYCERGAAFLLARADALRFFKARRAFYEKDLGEDVGIDGDRRELTV
jgi:hypothetical protein